ncbi:MAG: hypothetical protein ACR2Q3_06550, partial [Woeseiaceae bacterium]
MTALQGRITGDCSGGCSRRQDLARWFAQFKKETVSLTTDPVSKYALRTIVVAIAEQVAIAFH